MPVELLYAWMMIFLRGLGLIVLFPTLGTQPMPVTVRVALSALLSGLLYGLVPHVSVLPGGNGGLIYACAGEVVLGLVMGFAGRLVFSAIEMTGRMVTQEIGLMAAPGMEGPAPSSEPLAAFLSTFAGVMFFLLGGHLSALSAFARSFDFAPAGAPAFSGLAAEHLIAATGHVIELGFRMAAPFIAMNFLITLSFSVLGRAVPRMNVFILSYPVRVVVGMVLLAGSGALLTRYLQPEFNNIPLRILEMVAPI